jgi:hypothetical protein
MNATGAPKPKMYVKKEFDDKWIGNFMRKKHLALSELIGKPETTYLYFSLGDFTDLIQRISSVLNVSGVRIYFASYCTTGISQIDTIGQSGYMDQLTLIFAPTDGSKNDLGQYFLVNPSGGVINAPRTAAKAMISSYQTIKIPLLTDIINTAGIGNFNETTSFWYTIDCFNGPYDIIKEMGYDGAVGITAFIGSYGKGDPVSPTDPRDVSWQLNLIFDLVKTINYNGTTYHYHIDLEDVPGFGSRPDTPPVPPNTSVIFGGDTGNPCPPASCGAGLP